MPLLLCDLDDTLIDRAGAVRRWAERYLEDRGCDRRLASKVVAIDADGHTDRDAVAAELTSLLSLSDTASGSIVSVMRQGIIDELVLDDAVVDALREARGLGWWVVIVTNGDAERQEAKIRRVGLDAEVDGWVVSGAVGVAKPDPAIFHLAARTVDADLGGAWMIGDLAETDIAGAHATGISSVWLHRGRRYPEGLPHPTDRAASFGEAWEIVHAEGQ